MRITRRLPFFVLVLLCLAPIVALAADCPALVKAALAAADKSCGDTGRNQACYGNIQLQATAKDGTQPLAFSKPGDKVDVGTIQSLKLSSMNQQTNQWGVALMKVQANIPDTLPGQNVTLLLFGNVELTPTGSNVNTLQAFTFKSAIGDSPCSQAPNGLLIQSPVGGQRVALTINGANFDVGSTVFINSEPGEGDNINGTGMSISTLAGIVRITAQGKTVTSIQGTATGVALDDDLQPVAPPEDPAPLVAEELAPLVETVQADTDLLAPLADDAAANPTIADLTAQGILAPITADDPVNAIDPDKLTDATNQADEELNQAETPEQTETPDQPQTPDETNVPDQSDASLITAGYWKASYGNSTTVGTCRAAFGSCGGSDCTPEENKRSMLCAATNPVMIYINGGGGIPFTEAGTGDYVNEDTTPVQDLVKGGSYNLTTKSEYKVVSPTQIQEIDTYQEEGGCTVTTPTTYTLVKADPAVCSLSPTPEPTNVPNTTNTAVTAGKYTITFAAVGPACPNPELLPAAKATQVSVGTDGSLTLNLNDSPYVFTNSDGSYSYQNFTKGVVLITIDTVTPQQLTGSYTASDASGKACVANLTLDLAR